MEEKIDVLMATYNGEKYVKSQIDSILNQTYKNLNLIILDDKSKDKTVAILKEYENKDKRVKVYINDENLGSTKTFEKLLSYVKSDYFMFSDQDDIWYEDKIKKSYNFLKEKNFDMIYTDLEVYTRNDDGYKLISNSFNKLKNLKYKQIKYSDYRLELLYNTITGSTILCKSKYISKLVPFPDNKDLIHDAWIGLYMSLKYKIGYLDVPTVKYMQHENNQIGSGKYTDRFNKFSDVRNHFINVKLSRFNTILENKDRLLSDDLNIEDTCNEAILYFNHLKNKKIINFKYLNVFIKLYKWDSFKFILLQNAILNIPFISSFIYKFKKRK